jgi:hypothetical protein
MGGHHMKILALDIETAPNVAHVWGVWKQNIAPNQLMQTGRVMCFAARWLGEDGETLFYSEQGGKRARTKMVKAAHALMTEADVTVHYNGTSFDMPTLNREFLKADIGPPAPYQQVDLLKVVRSEFRFVSNRLDNILKELKIGSKVEHHGHKLWVGCMNGDPEAWATMEEYNRGDVDQLETLYYRLLPWIRSHPNHALYRAASLNPACPNCDSIALQRRGFQYAKTQKYQRYHCQSCGAWSRERFTSCHKDDRRLVQA